MNRLLQIQENSRIENLSYNTSLQKKLDSYYLIDYIYDSTSNAESKISNNNHEMASDYTLSRLRFEDMQED